MKDETEGLETRDLSGGSAEYHLFAERNGSNSNGELEIGDEKRSEKAKKRREKEQKSDHFGDNYCLFATSCFS